MSLLSFCRVIDSLYNLSRKILERCENCFVDNQEIRKALLFNEATYDIFRLTRSANTIANTLLPSLSFFFQ